MFGKKDAATVRISSIIGHGCGLQGDFTSEGSARVDGYVSGNVKVAGMLIVGTAGRIGGIVEADEVIIGGEVQGSVVAVSGAELTAGARVAGDVWSPKIICDENAVVLGRCNVYQETPEGRRLVIPKSVKPSDRTGKRTAREALQDAFRASESDGTTDNTEVIEEV